VAHRDAFNAALPRFFIERLIRQSYHGHLQQRGLVASQIEMEKNAWNKQTFGKSRPEITPFGQALITFIDGKNLE